ncbi:MAG: hypothetical protein Q9212_007319 [Teloschistes hypoglaucus]
MEESLKERPALGARQIRLVSFQRSKIDQRTRCEFTIADLDNIDLNYIAISYLWGDPTIVGHIECTQGIKDIPLTASAQKIVDFFSDRRLSSRYFWIDSLCINQNDPHDKSEQVALMGNIYSSAFYVVAWLDPTEEGELAIRCMFELGIYFIHCKRTQVTPTSQAICELPGWSKGSQKWKAIDHLLDCPYFGRVWIVQELVMAPACQPPNQPDLKMGVNVQCNNLYIPWSLFMVAINGLFPLAWQLSSHKIFKERPTFPPPVLRFARDIAGLRSRRLQDQSITLLEALEQAATRQATLGSDKVFAVINLVQHDAIVSALRPDYSISTETVFTNAAAALLDESHDFGALHHAGVGRPDRLPGLPSWVADWRSSVFLNAFGRSGPYDIAHFSASGTEQAISNVDRREWSLAIKIIPADRVASIIMPPFGEPVSRIILTRALEKAYQALGTSSFYSGLHQSTIVSFLSGGALEDHKGIVFGPYLHAMRTRTYDMDSAELEKHFGACFSGGRVIFTTHGHGLLGWGPPGLRAGDMICIVIGAKTPFAIRPIKEKQSGDPKSDRWQLVGECYVQGLMHGEGLEMGERQDCVLV